jgi:hypothetical protein
MLLRIVQFLTLLLAAYFFGAAIQQNWLSPGLLDVSAQTFIDLFKSQMHHATLRIPLLITAFELLLVILLVMQSKQWRSFSYALLACALITIGIVSLINTQTTLYISREIYGWDLNRLPANWGNVRSEWLNYQFVNGLLMMGVCFFLFIGIFISLLPVAQPTAAYYEQPGEGAAIPAITG